MYRAIDNRPVFVIVHADQFERVRLLKLHDPVRVGREDNDGDRVWIRKLDSAARYQSTLPSRNRPADITDSLCRVWRIPELTEWVRSGSPGGDVPAEGDPAAILPVMSDRPLSPRAGDQEQPGGGDREQPGGGDREQPPEVIGDAVPLPTLLPNLAKRFGIVRPEAPAASANGKHRGKGKGKK